MGKILTRFHRWRFDLWRAESNQREYHSILEMEPEYANIEDVDDAGELISLYGAELNSASASNHIPKWFRHLTALVTIALLGWFAQYMFSRFYSFTSGAVVSVLGAILFALLLGFIIYAAELKLSPLVGKIVLKRRLRRLQRWFAIAQEHNPLDT